MFLRLIVVLLLSNTFDAFKFKCNLVRKLKQSLSAITVDFVDSSTIDEKVPKNIKMSQKLIELSQSVLESEDSDPRFDEIHKLIETLETQYIPIQTATFLSLALEGKWEHAYTNFLTPKRDKNIKLQIYQDITFEPLINDIVKGNISNIIKYHSLRPEYPHTGTLEIKNFYIVNSRGDLQMELEGHYFTPDKEIPPDVEEFLLAIQRTMPIDMFDPNDLYLKHSYIDPNVRIVRVGGPNALTNIIHVFHRQATI